jgi:hypothetical protein
MREKRNRKNKGQKRMKQLAPCLLIGGGSSLLGTKVFDCGRFSRYLSGLLLLLGSSWSKVYSRASSGGSGGGRVAVIVITGLDVLGERGMSDTDLRVVVVGGATAGLDGNGARGWLIINHASGVELGLVSMMISSSSAKRMTGDG